MGIHICVADLDGNDCPDWDYIRQGNDRDFHDLIDWEKTKYAPDAIFDGFQPTNINELRSKIDQTDWRDKKRYHDLLNFVEIGWWLKFSY